MRDDSTEKRDRAATSTLYFADGYHGGIVGHMPVGAWRDIVRQLEANPDWRVNVDVEPMSWRHVRHRDPTSYEAVRDQVVGTDGPNQVEIVGGSYAQPYAFGVKGESNVRHLVRGKQIHRRHFPETPIETYAVQEPCFTSALPGILRSLGFERAALKVTTAFAGYLDGIDEEIVDWVGPDGRSIPSVPRYASEDKVKVFTYESTGESWSISPIGSADGGTLADFVSKCADNGIDRPNGAVFQDLGWSAHPKLGTGEDSAVDVQYVRWEDYFDALPDPDVPWRFSQENVRCDLPWACSNLQTILQRVRTAETSLLRAEKLAALANVFAGAAFPAGELRDAWDATLLAQHHDTWIQATIGEGRGSWAWTADATTWQAEEVSEEVTEESTEALVRESTSSAESGDRWLGVVNALGTDRTDLVEATVATDPGTRDVVLFDETGDAVPTQVIPEREYDDDSLNAARVLFLADVPAMGYRSYRLEARPADESDGRTDTEAGGRGRSVTCRRRSDGTVRIESDRYRIDVAPDHGGVVESLYATDLDREFVDPDSEFGLAELQGYFIDPAEWKRSSDAPAEIDIVEDGPVRVRVEINASLGDCPVTTTLSVVRGQRLIDVETTVDFGEGTWVGDPWDVEDDERRTERRRSYHNDRRKVQAMFPVDLDDQSVFKSAPYDVCRSDHRNTFYTRWDEIKHNLVLDWVDVYDPDADAGLALLSGHTASYVHGEDHPLGLVLGWGWEGGYWWGKVPAEGEHRVSYALVPHDGRWDDAGIPEVCARWEQPPTATVSRRLPRDDEGGRSLLSVTDGVRVPTTWIDGSDLYIRLFNARDEAVTCEVELGVSPDAVYRTELDGEPIERLAVSDESRDDRSVSLDVPSFGLRTLRFDGVGTETTDPDPYLAIGAPDAAGDSRDPS